jgi:hypothetical protein
MSFRKQITVTAVCDGCGPDWWAFHDDLDAPPQFPDIATARRQLAEFFGWHITNIADGQAVRAGVDMSDQGPAVLSGQDPAVVLCQACAECASSGHQWSDWSAPLPDGDIAASRNGRDCERCGALASALLPAGHPESLTAKLPEEQEELLAALDAELFPSEAR